MVDKTIGVLATIVSLAALSVIISKKSNTANVVTSLLTGLSNLIKSAVSPVTG